MAKLEWLKLASADLLTIVDYISDDNPDAAQRVKDDIESRVKRLPDFPKMGRPGRIEGTRELVVLDKLHYCLPGGRVFHSNTSCITCSTTMATIFLKFFRATTSSILML